MLTFSDLGYYPTIGELVGYNEGEGVVIGANEKYIFLIDSLDGKEKKVPIQKVFPLDQDNV